jgi:hypothetical protein
MVLPLLLLLLLTHTAAACDGGGSSTQVSLVRLFIFHPALSVCLPACLPVAT